jgi:hypothetical protein
MPTQADIDALTAGVEQAASELANAKSVLQAQIDALGAQNPILDLGALQYAVSAHNSAVQDLAALKPEASAPAPDPTDSASPDA